VALVVDTSVLVAAERAEQPVERLLAPGIELAISVITLMQVQRGVERSVGARQRQRREAFLAEVGTLEVLPVDADVALVGARVWADLERRGMRIPGFDLLVAATALSNERPLLTADARRFSRVEGLDVRLVEAA
jgi:tRNA(fMet)-specific endonuclease VapC